MDNVLFKSTPFFDKNPGLSALYHRKERTANA
jgi:hypothetical protein